MNLSRRLSALTGVVIVSALTACSDELVVDPVPRGTYAVGSTNMRMSAEFTQMDDSARHQYLLGLPEPDGTPRFLTDVLAHPDAAWITDVAIPQDELYGPAAGQVLPVVSFVTFPASSSGAPRVYDYPYHNAQYGSFENMLAPGERPTFAEKGARYPLVLLAHGSSAHGLYDVRHAHTLSSHGYIVAVLNYGDDRTAVPNEYNPHTAFLRPLMTSAVLDALLDSAEFGPYIDADHIGITGHSFGGFTALSIAGGHYQGNDATVFDARIRAGVLAAPWVGGRYEGNDVHAFGDDNEGLSRVSIPMLCAFGTRDTVTEASFILPAMQQLSGPRYVIELIDQPHVFENPSWVDKDNWERTFFDAYLKGDAAALETLKVTSSMPGGGKDVQRFEYQRTALPTP